MTAKFLVTMAVAVTLAGVPVLAGAAGPREIYTSALGRERALRSAEHPPTLAQIRSVTAAYERVVRAYPTSGYADNALWQAGNLALLAYERFGNDTDRQRGLRLLAQLKSEYPSSSLVARVDETVAALNRPRPRATASAKTPPKNSTTTASSRTPSGPAPTETRAPATSAAVPRASSAVVAAAASSTADGVVTIKAVTRTLLSEGGVRFTIEMDGEALYHQERIDGPDRLFFDLKRTQAAPNLEDAVLKYVGTLVPEVRLGRRPDNATRVVMEMAGVDTYSVFPLYNPYRLVVDFHRAGAPAGTVSAAAISPPAPAAPTSRAVPSPATMTAAPAVPPPPAPAPLPAVSPKAEPLEPTSRPLPSRDLAGAAAPLPSRDLSRPLPPVPAVPVTNSNGQFSIARQLGLGISRVVIDAGHGGHDPGARGNGIEEAELVLDVAQRVRKLLEAQPGVEVVMTRESDVFIPLEERPAIANREGADLFLSIHANASRNVQARGIETYFLNFASNPQAEAVAARENSASGRTMHSLPDIVRAIALNNKIDESRDFADMVQKSMVKRLQPRNAALRDLGVKQAPFVVLIGASMPAVLAEISFVTHKQEGQLLKSSAYRQTIAQALADAVQDYQKSLKVRNAIAAR